MFFNQGQPAWTKRALDYEEVGIQLPAVCCVTLSKSLCLSELQHSLPAPRPDYPSWPLGWSHPGFQEGDQKHTLGRRHGSEHLVFSTWCAHHPSSPRKSPVTFQISANLTSASTSVLRFSCIWASPYPGPFPNARWVVWLFCTWGCNTWRTGTVPCASLQP